MKLLNYSWEKCRGEEDQDWMATIISICFLGQVLDEAVKTGLLMHPVDSLYNFTWNNTKPLTSIVMVHVLLLLHFLVLFLVFFVTLIEITRGDSTESTFLEHIFLILWRFSRLHLHQSKVSYVPIQRTVIYSCMQWMPSIMNIQY